MRQILWFVTVIAVAVAYAPAAGAQSDGTAAPCSDAALEAPYLVIGNLSANVVTVWNGETYERIATIPLKDDDDTPREHSSPIGTWATGCRTTTLARSRSSTWSP